MIVPLTGLTPHRRRDEGRLMPSGGHEGYGEGMTAEVQRLLGGHAALLERLPVVTFVSEVGERTRLLYVSPQIEALLGYPAHEWLGDSPLFAERVHPDDRDRVLRALPH